MRLIPNLLSTTPWRFFFSAKTQSSLTIYLISMKYSHRFLARQIRFHYGYTEAFGLCVNYSVHKSSTLKSGRSGQCTVRALRTQPPNTYKRTMASSEVSSAVIVPIVELWLSCEPLNVVYLHYMWISTLYTVHVHCWIAVEKPLKPGSSQTINNIFMIY